MFEARPLPWRNRHLKGYERVSRSDAQAITLFPAHRLTPPVSREAIDISDACIFKLFRQASVICFAVVEEGRVGVDVGLLSLVHLGRLD